MIKAIAVLIALVGCGDNYLPPLEDASLDAHVHPDAPPDAAVFTWRDAEVVWADAWCSMAERCHPEAFALKYGDHVACTATISQENCALRPTGACAEAYPPEQRAYLTTCHMIMATLACGVTTAPSVCYAAFQGSPEAVIAGISGSMYDL